MAVGLDALLKIKAETSGANSVVALRQGITDLGRASKAAEGGMKSMGGAVAGLSGLMGALTPLLSVAGIMALGAKAIETGDKFFDLAQKTGVSVEALAKFSKAAALNGTDIDGVAKGLGKLSKAMLTTAQSGTGPAADAFRVLGINVTDASGQLRGADQVMLEIADRFKQMPDGATKTALAIQLLGKSGAELIPMLNQGGEAISKFSVKMTAEFAARADEFKDKTTMLNGAVNGLGITVANVLLPTLIDLAAKLIDVTKQVVSYVEDNKEALQTVMNWISAFAKATGMALRFTIDQVAAVSRVLGRLSMGDFAGAINEAQQFIANFKDQAGKDFQELAATINGTGQQAAGAVSTVKQQVLDLTTAEEAAKEKQAQWKAWVDETVASYGRMQFAMKQSEQAIAGQQKVLDARVGAELAINNAAKTMLQIRLSTASTDQERLEITRQMAAIDINSAEIQREAADAQIDAMVQEVRLKIASAQTAAAQAEATLAEARARGIATGEYEKALQAQLDLVEASMAELGIAQQVAKYKSQAADATYDAAVAQAQASIDALKLKTSTQQAANNIRQLPSSLDSAADAANRLANGMQMGADAAASMALGLGGFGRTVPSFTRMASSDLLSEHERRQLAAMSISERFAAGGFVQGPTAAMIGEGGQPEYVIPASKMAAASSRYLSGARGEAVLSGGGGSGPVTINVKTGPVMEFNGDRYVKLEELDRAMRITAEGVIGRLRTPAARRALGVT